MNHPLLSEFVKGTHRSTSSNQGVNHMKIQQNFAIASALTASSCQHQRQTSATPTAAIVDTTSISPAAMALSQKTERSVSSGASVTEIMSRYNLRDISYTSLVQMAGELRNAGALQEKDYLDFIGPSPEFSSIPEQRVPDWNRKQDYVGLHEQRLGFLQSIGSEQRFIDFEKHILSLFQRFESFQS